MYIAFVIVTYSFMPNTNNVDYNLENLTWFNVSFAVLSIDLHIILSLISNLDIWSHDYFPNYDV
jgi:hypothetical protein